MRDSINQAQLTLEIENFLKHLKRRSREWDGFYSQLTNLLLRVIPPFLIELMGRKSKALVIV